MKRFNSMPKKIKLIRFCNAIGIVPDILLTPKYNSLSFVDKLPIELSKTPLIWFNSIDNNSILVQFPKDVKKSKSLPNLLEVRTRSSRSSSYPKLVRTNPSNRLVHLHSRRGQLPIWRDRPMLIRAWSWRD